MRTSVVFLRGGACTPRCVRLASGGTVMFLGSLFEQPVEPRALGIDPSPIVSSRFGGLAEFEFPNNGFFPFRRGTSRDAIGVVWSTFW